MPALYIAEKPSLGKTIAEVIGIARKDGKSIILKDGSRMTWAFGHLLEPASPDAYIPDSVPRSQKTGRKIWRKEDLPIVPQAWKMLPRDKEIAGHIKQIGAWLSEVDHVVHCGDPDREGQAIVDNVLVALKNQKPVKRLWVRDLTADGIRKALASMKDNGAYKPLFDAALARSRADWLVGMNLTRAATLANSGGSLVSIGRVQTPTLALIAKRDITIEKFVPIDHFGVKATIGADPAFGAVWQIPDDLKSPDGYLLEKDKAATVVAQTAGQAALVKRMVQKDGKKTPPLPFSLSALQKYASAKLNMGAQAVLDTAQSLYEKHKATSYPRTDCQYMADNQHADAPGILAQLKALPSVGGVISEADTSRKSAAFNDKKITAHTAIIPTGVIPTGLSTNEQKLYDAIVKFYVAQFLPDQTFKNTTITLAVGNHTFVAKGKQILNPGWTVIFGGSADDEHDEDSNGALPAVSEGQSLPVTGADVQAKQTKPPARFTEGTLIDAMSSIARFIDDPEAKKVLKETEGLGTEATRANIIETLKKRGFIEPKGKQLISTAAGRGAIKVVPAAMRDPVTTAQWEGRLDAIGRGEETLDGFLHAQTEFVVGKVKELSSASINLGGGKGSEPVGKCPCCGGAVIETPKAYSCSKYRETGCKFAIWKTIAGKKISPTIAKELLTKGATAKEVSGFKSKAGKDFSAKLALKDGKVEFVFEERKAG
jgi:DNA topoisomerase-3